MILTAPEMLLVRAVVAVDLVSRLDQQCPKSREAYIAMHAGLKVGLDALHAADDLSWILGNPSGATAAARY